jgi:WD40 repeat protein
VSAEVAARLAAATGAYLTGDVTALSEARVLEDKDFVYSIAVSADGRRVAFSHLGPKKFQLALWRWGAAPAPIADADINPYEADVEAVAFSPDSQTVVAASRDGALRFYGAKDGALEGVYATDEPLVSVAFHPSGQYVLAGSASGLLMAVAFPALSFSYEVRAHAGELRSVAVSADGSVFTGGWDKTLAAWSAAEAPALMDHARVHFERRGELSVVRGSLDGRAAAAFAFDARVTGVVITPALAQAAGVDVSGAQPTTTLPTAMGTTQVPLSPGHTLSFKALRLEDVTLAVCDVCVPPGLQGVLGAPFLKRVQVVFDDAAHEAVLTAASSEAPQLHPALVLLPRHRTTFDAFVNDVSVDRAGKALGVAFSEQKAERTREVYEREKKGVPEPARAGDCAAVIDAASGQVVKRWHSHLGVVATAGISPDGRTLATGGWDRRLVIQNLTSDVAVAERRLGWSIRRVRFSEDGRFVLVGAWTPQNPLGAQHSAPSAVIYETARVAPGVVEPGQSAVKN